MAKDSLKKRISDNENHIARTDFLKRQGSILDQVYDGDVYELKASTGTALLLPIRDFRELFNHDESSYDDFPRVGSKELKGQKSSKVFEQVFNRGKAWIITRHNLDTAALIERSQAERLCDAQGSLNRRHFNEIVREAIESGNDVQLKIAPDGSVTASIKSSGLEALRQTIDEYGLTPGEVAEEIERSYKKAMVFKGSKALPSDPEQNQTDPESDDALGAPRPE